MWAQGRILYRPFANLHMWNTAHSLMISLFLSRAISVGGLFGKSQKNWNNKK